MLLTHKALIQKLFRNKTTEQRNQYIELVESVLTAKIHPYQFLLLIDHFPSFAEASEAFVKVDTTLKHTLYPNSLALNTFSVYREGVNSL